MIATDFIEEMYVHMGFAAAYSYREVHELVFEGGKLISESDRSGEMSEFRTMLGEQPVLSRDDENFEEIEQWVAQTFSRDFRW